MIFYLCYLLIIWLSVSLPLSIVASLSFILHLENGNYISNIANVKWDLLWGLNEVMHVQHFAKMFGVMFNKDELLLIFKHQQPHIYLNWSLNIIIIHKIHVPLVFKGNILCWVMPPKTPTQNQLLESLNEHIFMTNYCLLETNPNYMLKYLHGCITP